MLEHCCSDLLPFRRNSISEVRHWCWAIWPGSQSAFQLIPKVSDGVEVRALCMPVKFFHTDLDKPFLYGPRFVHRGIMLKQERAFPKLLPLSWKHRIFTVSILLASNKSRLVRWTARLWSVIHHSRERVSTAIVAPGNFHFTIKAVDRDSSSRAEIWWTDLLERWHPMTVPSWKSLSSSVRQFYCQCFVYWDCTAVCSILYTCQQWLWL